MEMQPKAIKKKERFPPAFANTLMNPLKAMPNTEPEVTEQYYSDSDSYESSSGASVIAESVPTNLPKTSFTGPENDKQEIFLKLMALKNNKGVILSKEFRPNSDYTELKLEYERQNKMLRNEAGIKFARRMLMGCVTGMEFLNNKFDPIGAKLNGWSENVMESISEYDDVFEKLYEKYSSDTEMAPEFQLLFTLGGSAFMFHLTNTMFKSNLPNISHPAYVPPSAPESIPQTSNINKERPIDTSSIFKQNNAPPDMPGPSSNLLAGLPNISDALKKGPSVPIHSRPETFTGSNSQGLRNRVPNSQDKVAVSQDFILDDDRFSDGSDSKISDLSEVRSVSINMNSGGSPGKNKITIGR